MNSNTALAKKDGECPSALSHDARVSFPTLYQSRQPATAKAYPKSRHRAPNGVMPWMGFSMRPELFNQRAIEAAVYLKDGFSLTMERIRSAFYAQWGVESCQWQAKKDAASQELQHLSTEQVQLAECLKSIPKTKTISENTLPRGITRLGWFGLVAALIALNLMALFNTASYFRFTTQSWLIAILWAAPLLFVSLPVKYVLCKLSERARRRFGMALSVIGVVAFAVFLYTLADRAEPASAADIMQGMVRNAHSLIPWQLGSQVLLEVVMASGLWFWVIDLLQKNTTRVILNPDLQVVASRLSILDKTMESARTRLAEAEGNLREFEGSLNTWLKLGETVYMTRMAREKHLADSLADFEACFAAQFEDYR